MTSTTAPWTVSKPTALLVLADGTVIEGHGLGATGEAVGEVCFNTAMTGYQEILTDPSYAGQIITFTFPHIGNVGTNDEDIETVNLAAVRACAAACSRPTSPTRRTTRSPPPRPVAQARGIIAHRRGRHPRADQPHPRKGMPNGVIAHDPDGKFDLDALKRQAAEWPGLEGLDLAPEVSAAQRYDWDETPWAWPEGYGGSSPARHVVAIDYGAKRNILRCLASRAAR
jgi:carbamoyl-phosphate synthase small subunit